MSLTKEQVRSLLTNRRVLVVEDDTVLAGKIVSILQQYTVREPKQAHCMEEAREMLSDASFDLAVMDVMLPRDREGLEAIRSYDRQIQEARRVMDGIGENPTSEVKREQLLTARFRRAEAIAGIAEILDKQGGIELVRECHGGSRCLPVLFLTCVGNEPEIEQGTRVAGWLADWLVKPVASDDILEKASQLLDPMRRK